MAAIVYSTALKTAHLTRLALDGDKYASPTEHGARVRRMAIDVTAGASGIGTANPVVVAKIDKPCVLVGMDVVASATVTTAQAGTTPQSNPVDTVSNLQAAVIHTANTPVRPAGAIGLEITEPTFVVWKPASGSLAAGETLKGSILYVENS